MANGEASKRRHIYLHPSGWDAGYYVELEEFDGDWWAEREIEVGEDDVPRRRTIGQIGLWADSDLKLSDFEADDQFRVEHITERDFNDKWREGEALGLPTAEASSGLGCAALFVLLVGGAVIGVVALFVWLISQFF